MIIIGYSGHAYVAIGILHAGGKKVTGYCDFESKVHNPFMLTYLGSEQSEKGLSNLSREPFFIGIGDNAVRRKVHDYLSKLHQYPVNAVHPSAIIDGSSEIESEGIMISAGVCINPLASIHRGAICNTGCIIEHECVVGAFAHIGPGAVLCGNVTVGEGSFIGAGSVIRQGITIGRNVTIGAGAVVIKDIADGYTVVGNPSKSLNRQ